MAETAAAIASTLQASGYLADPHTATGLHVARTRPGGDAPMIVLATAHPAKFPDSVEAAVGIRPNLPSWLADLMERSETYSVLPSDVKMVEDHISRHARVTG
jgi:threonine synthase